MIIQIWHAPKIYFELTTPLSGSLSLSLSLCLSLCHSLFLGAPWSASLLNACQFSVTRVGSLFLMIQPGVFYVKSQHVSAYDRLYRCSRWPFSWCSIVLQTDAVGAQPCLRVNCHTERRALKELCEVQMLYSNSALTAFLWSFHTRLASGFCSFLVTNEPGGCCLCTVCVVIMKHNMFFLGLKDEIQSPATCHPVPRRTCWLEGDSE